MSLWVANKGEPEMGSPFRSRPSVLSIIWGEQWILVIVVAVPIKNALVGVGSVGAITVQCNLISGLDAGDFRDQEAAKVDLGVRNFNKACPVVTNVRSVFGSSTIIVPAA